MGGIVVAEVQGGRDQGADVDLARSAEDDAVLVDEINLAIGLDLAENLARHAGRVIDLVERHPSPVAALVKRQGRGLADVELRPVHERVFPRLLDRDGGLSVARRLCWRIGVDPRRYRVALTRRGQTAVRYQPTRGQAVRHRWKAGAEAVRSGDCEVARGGLRRLHGLDRLRCPRPRVLALPGA